MSSTFSRSFLESFFGLICPIDPIWAFHLVFSGINRVKLNNKFTSEAAWLQWEEKYKKHRGEESARRINGSCCTERFLVSKKPHGRVVKREPCSQAFELSEALPCTHGYTYVQPLTPPSSTQILYLHNLSDSPQTPNWSCPENTKCIRDVSSLHIRNSSFIFLRGLAA